MDIVAFEWNWKKKYVLSTHSVMFLSFKQRKGERKEMNEISIQKFQSEISLFLCKRNKLHYKKNMWR